ncbi:hypothetical protein M1523_01420 [Patescibacteria group bacterium]|nr:hypothetical protein [Patescibacteria group bacterium]MCL5091560.1 hypothetical protein [Patescibacteria group bacterium]
MRKVAVFCVSLLILSPIYLSISLTRPVLAAGVFQQAYTTLTNSRFSYYGSVNTAVATGGSDVVVKSSGEPDNDTNNLFNGDILCFNNPASTGCANQTTYTTSNVVDSTHFSVSSGVTGGLQPGDRVVASQSARMAITFQPTTVANLNHIRIYVPAASSSSGDGIPDSGKFDANTLDTDIASAGVVSLSCSASCAGAETLTSPAYSTTTIAGQTYHMITATTGGTWSTSRVYTVTLGHASTVTDRFINPAPSGTSHTRGVGDKLVVTVQTENSTNDIIEKADTGVTANDGVFVSAYVPISVTWTISGIAASQSVCGTTTSVATTATSVPFGTIYASDTFFDAAHLHTITTNAPGGYVLQVMSDGDPKKNGSTPTIPSNRTNSCDGSCTTTVTGTWATATNSGFGYTLSGTNASFSYTSGYRLFDSTGFQTIGSYSSTISSDTIYTCYRLSVSGTQTAGLYWDKITYHAYPKF